MKSGLISAGTASLLLLGTREVSAQTIASFTPQVGSTGDKVTIIGNGFSIGTIKVYFSDQKLDTAGQPTSDSQIVAFVPAGAVTGPITVQRDSNPPVSSDDIFEVIGPGPFITDVTPSAGSPNDLVIISGVHLATVTKVMFNTTPSLDPSPNASGTQISTHVPVGATSGYISVTTPSGTSNSPAPFTVIGPGPYISGFSPTFGNSGTQVIVSGGHFTGAQALLFNGVPGANFFVSSDTSITVNAPAKLTTGPLTVIGPIGTNTTATNFFAPPVITGFSPATGRAGTQVVITGTNLAGASPVLFANTPAIIGGASDNFNLYVVVPAGAASGPIRVFTPGFSVLSKSNFTFQPTISGFAPSAGIIGSSVTVFGANLNEGLSHVRFNNVDATLSLPQFDRVTVAVPAGATTGPISVTTTNGTFITNTNFFLPATITDFSPNDTAPGTQVTITGQNLLGTTALQFGGVPGSFNLIGNTSLSATVPAGVITGPITLTTPANTASSGTRLFYGMPGITNFSPTHGLPGTPVTIYGSNFLGASAVRFNGANASTITVVNNGTIQTVVPANSLTGPIAVVAPAGTNASLGNFVVDFASDLALITTAAPVPVFWSSNLVYTVSVTNAGPSDAPNAIVSDTLPPALIYKSGTTTKGTITANGNKVTASLGNLPVSGSATITVTVAPQALGTIINTISVSSDYPDPITANNTNVLSTLVLPLPLLEIQPYSPGQLKISWPVMLTNYALESKSLLDPNYVWSGVGSLPLVSGTNSFVIEVISGASKFYRLKD